MQFWKYTVGSALGIMPGVCLYVMIGRLASSIAQVSTGNMDEMNNPVLLFTTVGVPIVILVILIVVLTRFECQKPSACKRIWRCALVA